MSSGEFRSLHHITPSMGWLRTWSSIMEWIQRRYSGFEVDGEPPSRPKRSTSMAWARVGISTVPAEPCPAYLKKGSMSSM